MKTTTPNTCIIPRSHRGVFNIDFLGNERDLIYALRAINKMHAISSEQNTRYAINLYGRFPPGLLWSIDANLTWAGSEDDYYYTKKDADVTINARAYDRAHCLCRYYESMFGVMESDFECPEFVPSKIPNKTQLRYRMTHPTAEVGNMIFFLAPSTEDPEWGIAFSRVKFFQSVIDQLFMKKYCIAYPQIVLTNGCDDSVYNHHMYYQEGQERISEYCYMPSLTDIESVAFWLLQSGMYVGWDNWIADIAKAFRIPSIIFTTTPTISSDYYINPREGDALIETVVLPTKESWNATLFEKAYDRIQKGFHTVH